VKAYLDGKLITQLTTSYRDPIKNTYWGLDDRLALGLASYASPTVFHSAEVLELSGPGVFTRPDGDTPKKVLEVQKKKWPALTANCLGVTKLDKGDLTGALEEFDKAIKLGAPSRDLASFYYNRGRTKMRMVDDEGAARDFEKSISLEPEDTDRRYMVGLHLFDIRRLAEARAHLTQALEVLGKRRSISPYLIFRIWEIDLLEGKALAEVRANAKKTRDEVKPSAWLGRLYAFFCGELDEVALIKAAADRDPHVQKGKLCEAYYYSAMVRLAAGDKPGARKLLEQCVSTERTKFVEYNSAKRELVRLK
jgi:lipoprotein NlpI